MVPVKPGNSSFWFSVHKTAFRSNVISGGLNPGRFGSYNPLLKSYDVKEEEEKHLHFCEKNLQKNAK